MKNLLKFKKDIRKVESDVNKIKNDIEKEIHSSKINCNFTVGDLKKIKNAIEDCSFIRRCPVNDSFYYNIYCKIKDLLKDYQ